jgi:hypothetical protein
MLSLYGRDTGLGRSTEAQGSSICHDNVFHCLGVYLPHDVPPNRTGFGGLMSDTGRQMQGIVLT